jgi:hypothetical protein
VAAANAEVSWSEPTDTHPSLAATSYTPWGSALGGCGEGKSCASTRNGAFAGDHSRP